MSADNARQGYRSREFRGVSVSRGDAETTAAHLRQQGRRPRIYERVARAENMTIRIWVVCCAVERSP